MCVGSATRDAYDLEPAENRRTVGTAASTRAAIQNIKSIALVHFAPAAEKPMPVAAVNHAARHSGHLGSNTSAAPGRIEAAALESRRVRRRDATSPTQHCFVITQVPRACNIRPSRAASHTRL